MSRRRVLLLVLLAFNAGEFTMHVVAVRPYETATRTLLRTNAQLMRACR